MFLEEIGVKADIEAKKIETDESIAALQKLLAKAEHDIAVLTKESVDFKAKIKTTTTENSTLRTDLAAQKEKTRKIYDELSVLFQKNLDNFLITDTYKRCQSTYYNQVNK